MSAKDIFHVVVKTALQKNGWLITHDPYPLQAGSFDLAIDLGAEKFIAAERQGIKIAVEIKSFLGPSKITEFYKALGQEDRLSCCIALARIEPYFIPCSFKRYLRTVFYKSFYSRAC